MSKLKFENNLFIEKQELDKMWLFLTENGFVRNLLLNSSEFGIIKNPKDLFFDNLKVIRGVNSGTVTIKEGYGIDKFGNIFTNRFEKQNVSVPNDGFWYWVKIRHIFSSKEKGTVSVSGDGVLTGSNTEFLKVLRGFPNFASKIRFFASANSQDYEVAEVVDDTNAILAGQFIAESGLEYAIIGTFTPGYVPLSNEREVFQHSSSEITFLRETINGTPPPFEPNYEFYLCRVKINGSEVELQDKRQSYYKTHSGFEISNLDNLKNLIIGIENVKWDNLNSPRHENIVTLAWGIRSTNYTFNSSLNQVTINACVGGIIKSVADTQNEMFNGWRLYINGKYFLIRQSVKNGNQLDLFLETLDPSFFSRKTEIVVVPNVEEILIKFSTKETNRINSFEVAYPINLSFATIKIPVYELNTNNFTCAWNLVYKYKNHKHYGEYIEFPNGSYFTELNFDELGNAIFPPPSGNLKNYEGSPTTAFLELRGHPLTFSKFKDAVYLGDLLGVEQFAITSGQILDFEVGVKKQYQVIVGNSSISQNVVFNIKTRNVKGGNKFFFHFRNKANFTGTTNIIFTQDYINADSPGIVIKTLDVLEKQKLATGNEEFLIQLVYNQIIKEWMAFSFKNQTSEILNLNDLTTSLQELVGKVSPYFFTRAGSVSNFDRMSFESLCIADGWKNSDRIEIKNEWDKERAFRVEGFVYIANDGESDNIEIKLYKSSSALNAGLVIANENATTDWSDQEDWSVSQAKVVEYISLQPNEIAYTYFTYRGSRSGFCLRVSSPVISAVGI